MQFLTLFWWEWAAYLFGFSSCLYVGIWLLWMLKRQPSVIALEPLNPTSEIYRNALVPQRRGKVTVYIAGLMLTLILGVVIGRASLKREFNSNVHPMPDTLVTALNSDGSYQMLAKDGRKFSTLFCHGRDDLLPGNKLKEFTFEQKMGCKNIHGYGLGYVAYTEHGVRIKFPIPEETADAR